MRSSFSRMLKAVLVLGAVPTLLASGCVRRTTVPIRTVRYPAPDAKAAKTLVVLLPGRGDIPEDFERYGFVEDLHRARPDADLIAVDSHLGYFREGSIRVRLWEDVLEPAQAKGYKQIWLVGCSLGGCGSLTMAEAHPGAISGVVVLAPYLGPTGLITDIETSGGPHMWHAKDPNENFQDLWGWMKGESIADGTERVFLGYGDKDGRVGPADRQLAKLLPPGQVVRIPGAHDWKTWRVLLGQLLDKGAIAPVATPIVPVATPAP